ncbi:hypothetical protein ASG59_11765 [Methylobacterium sp. Leaf466]|nr:hypothetical protein ASG59_11765 [Methylobacterium sp. Leaf466]
MTRTLSLIALLALTGCSGVPPLVDMTGVDAAAYSRDQIVCNELSRERSFYVGDFVSDCLTRKGYKVQRIDRLPRGTGE